MAQAASRSAEGPDCNALATRVLFDGSGRAIGVEYPDGERLYGAHPRPSTRPASTRQVFAAREVILAGGAFNTPQLLMLSGIGPKQTLESHGIAVRVGLDGRRPEPPGPLRSRRRQPHELPGLEGARGRDLHAATTPSIEEWANDRDGVYSQQRRDPRR